MITASDLLPLLEDTAREAGALALGHQRAGVEAWSKKDTTPVSEADIAVDTLIKERLRTAQPTYGWLSEETKDDPARLSKSRVFIVDPIDGTRAFLKGKPEWVISIALVEDEAPIAGAVFNPVTDEMFTATADTPTRLNGETVNVTARENLEGCHMVAFPDMFPRPEWPTPWPIMDIRQRNAVAYRMALVAGGLADAMVSLSFKHEWDTAAGALLVTRAGGRVSDHLGARLRFNQPSPRGRSVIAAGPALHAEIKARVDFVPDERIAGYSRSGQS